MLQNIFFYFLKDYYNYAQLYGSIPLFHFNIFAFLYLFPDIFLFSVYLLCLTTLFYLRDAFFSFILLNVLLEQMWVFLFVFYIFVSWKIPCFLQDIVTVCFILWLLHGIILEFHVIPFTKYSFNRIMQKAWLNANQVSMLVGFIIDGTG